MTNAPCQSFLQPQILSHLSLPIPGRYFFLKFCQSMPSTSHDDPSLLRWIINHPKLAEVHPISQGARYSSKNSLLVKAHKAPTYSPFQAFRYLPIPCNSAATCLVSHPTTHHPKSSIKLQCKEPTRTSSNGTSIALSNDRLH